MRARGSSSGSGASGGTGMYVDPLEWARRRQAAVEHAARLREERSLGGPLDESYTFTPQINRAPPPTQQLALARARTQQRAPQAVASRRRSQHQQLQQQHPTARDGFLLPAASRSGSVASIASTGGSSYSSSYGDMMPPSLRAVGASSLSAASSFALATVAPAHTHRPHATAATATTTAAVAQHTMTATVASMRRTNSGSSSTSTSTSRKVAPGWGTGGGNSGAEPPMLVLSPRRGLPPSIPASPEEATVGLGAGQTSAFAKTKRSASLSSSSGSGSAGSPRKERGPRAKDQPQQPQEPEAAAAVSTTKPAWVSHWEGQAPAAPAALPSPNSSLALLKAKLSRGKTSRQQHGAAAAVESEDERAAIRAAEGRDGGWGRKGSGGKEKEPAAGATGAGRPLWVDEGDEWHDARDEAEAELGRKASSSSPARKGPRRLRRRWSSGPFHDMDLRDGPSAAAQQEQEEEHQPRPPPPRSVVAAAAAKRRQQQQAQPAAAPPSRFAPGGGGGGASLIPCDGCGRQFNERAFEVHSKICRDVFQSRRAVFDSRRKRLAGTDAGKYHASSSVAAQARPLPPRKRQGAKPKQPAAAPAPVVAAAAVESLRRLKGRQQQQQPKAGAIARYQEKEDEATSQGGFRSLSTNSSASSLGLKQRQHQQQHDKPFPATLEAQATPQWKQQSEAFRAMLRRNRAISQAEKEGRDISSPAFLASLPPAGPDATMTTEPLVPCPHCRRKFAQTTAERHVPKCADIQHKPTTLRRGGGMGLGKAARERGPGMGKGFSVRL